MKERIEALEPEKNLMVARVIGGDLMKEFKNFFLTIQATPKQRGPGSVVKCHLKYERIDKKVADPEDILVLFVNASTWTKCFLLNSRGFFRNLFIHLSIYHLSVQLCVYLSIYCVWADV
uniref:Bet v I/Major latex protein domain-containing protein n=1 Tax=Brassica oleracea var. oleracea TaxID=109376 RepID=A0A0D3D764_BRAOL